MTVVAPCTEIVFFNIPVFSDISIVYFFFGGGGRQFKKRARGATGKNRASAFYHSETLLSGPHMRTPSIKWTPASVPKFSSHIYC